MKIIESHDVMESFNMHELTVEDLFEVDGGFCFPNLSISCSCKGGKIVQGTCPCKGNGADTNPCPSDYTIPSCPSKSLYCPNDNSC